MRVSKTLTGLPYSICSPSDVPMIHRFPEPTAATREISVTGTRPPRRRRKEARPSEILDAATRVFLERGFAATRLEDVARTAGVAKGTLYLYFSSKEQLFEEVAKSALASHVSAIAELGADPSASLEDVVPLLLDQAVGRSSDPRIMGLVRMVISESAIFPQLAVVWHETLFAGAASFLANLISREQAAGSVIEGDPKIHAMSIIGPVFMGAMLGELLGQRNMLPAVQDIARQHASLILRGLLR